MDIVQREALVWMDSPYPGIKKAVCASHDEGGALTYWEVPKGCGFPDHGHKGFEYTIVVAGKLQFGHILAEPTDIVCTRAGERHSAVALEDSLILVINQRSNQ
jgi:quercetin dioxygenase-like cupin family protein